MKNNKLKYIPFAIPAIWLGSTFAVAETESASADISGLVAAITDSAPAQGEAKPSSEAAAAFTLPSSGSEGDADGLMSDGAAGETENVDGEEVYVLQDFEVSAEQDRGYLSANSLSGTRTNAKLKDTPMTIAVINEELIADLNLSEIGDLSEVIASVDQGDVSRFAPGKGASQLNIRGLLSQGQLYDFFPRNLPRDGYNVGRSEVAQGTNTLVMGQASPGGKANTTSKNAVFANDKTKLELIMGDHRWNATFDKNFEVNDQLAMRFMGTTGERTGQIVHSSREFDGLTFEATYRPTNNTSFGFHLEAVDQHTTSAVDRFTTGTALGLRTGLPSGGGAYFTPEVLDLYPQELIDHSLANNSEGWTTEEEIREFLSTGGFNYKNRNQFSGPDTVNHIWGHNLIVDVTHAFSDNLVGKLAFFHETGRGEHLRNARTTVDYNYSFDDSRAGGRFKSVGYTGADDVAVNEPHIRQSWGTISLVEKINSVRGTLSWSKEFEKSSHQLLLGVDLDHVDISDYRKQLIFDTPEYTLGGTYETNRQVAYSYFALEEPIGGYHGIRLADGPYANLNNGFDPLTYGQVPTLWAPQNDISVLTKSAALWTVLQSKFFDGRLNTLMGLRLDYEESDSNIYNFGRATGATEQNVGRSASPTLGGVYWLSEHFGVTGSWSRSIQNQTGRTVDPAGKAMPPEIGEGREVGFRFSVLDDSLTGGLTAYTITKINERSDKSGIPDIYYLTNYPEHFSVGGNGNLVYDRTAAFGYQVPGTVVRSQGFEVDLNYNPTRQLSFRFSYNNGIVKTIEGPGGYTSGDLRSGNSRHRATLTARYRFTDGPLKGVTAGVNQKFRSGPLLATIREDHGRIRNGVEQATLDGQGDYFPILGVDPVAHRIWLKDDYQTALFLGWTGQFKKGRGNPKYGIQLNVNNVFDQVQMTSRGRTLEGRNFTVKLSTEF